VGLKQLQIDPINEVYASLNIGDEVQGEVVKILPIGAIIKLNNGLSALAVTKENSDRANVATHHIYKLNAQVKGYISYINRDKRKINIITNRKTETN
jgi:ribosomal protein S1